MTTNEMTAAQALAWMAEKPGRVVVDTGGYKYQFIHMNKSFSLQVRSSSGTSWPIECFNDGTYTPVEEESQEPQRYPVTPETLGQFERVVVEDPRYLKNPVYSRVNNRWLKWEWIQIQLAFTNGLQCYSTEPPKGGGGA